VDQGRSHRQAASAAGVPVTTLRGWLYRGPPLRYFNPTPGCPQCGDHHNVRDVAPAAYVYLLGIYLGDGHICHQQGRCYSLRVAMDSAYPGIIAEVSEAIAQIRGRARWVGRDRRKNLVRICSYWRQWPCRFPQHGPGRKHSRRIGLERWQQALVDRAPGQFLRGLIHSDGWRGINQVNVKGRNYGYGRYQFSNRSEDIKRLFTDTCDALGIAWRPWGKHHISIARRDAVARLDEFVGLKT
jgi:hypothetical protein